MLEYWRLLNLFLIDQDHFIEQQKQDRKYDKNGEDFDEHFYDMVQEQISLRGVSIIRKNYQASNESMRPGISTILAFWVSTADILSLKRETRNVKNRWHSRSRLLTFSVSKL